MTRLDSKTYRLTYDTPNDILGKLNIKFTGGNDTNGYQIAKNPQNRVFFSVLDEQFRGTVDLVNLELYL